MANLKFPTLGGVQFWTDLRWWYDWRIQQNALTGHCRLLSPNNMRHYSGAQAACEAKLDEIIAEQTWPEPATRVVVCVHGLMRTRGTFASLGKRLGEHDPSLSVVHFGYASTRAPIENHSQALRAVIEGLPGNPKIDLVGHSLGNIVSRHALAYWQVPGNDPHQVISRLGRFVMQGPPNQGAQIARRLQTLGLFEIITGRSGVELGAAWDELQQHLCVPPCQFGIIAGSFNPVGIRNPLVDGESDFVVQLDETKLAGAHDFLTVSNAHSLMMDDKAVQAATIRFLDTGSFSEDGSRNPL